MYKRRDLERTSAGELCACDNALIAKATRDTKGPELESLSSSFYKNRQARLLCEQSIATDCRSLGYCVLAEVLITRATGGAVIPDISSDI